MLFLIFCGNPSKKITSLYRKKLVKDSAQTLENIIKECIKGKQSAQENLFKMFYGKMFGVCLRYIKDKDTAQEIVQEAFIKIFEKLDKFDFNGSFEGWIRRVLVNTAIDSIRKAKKDPFLVDNEASTFRNVEEDALEIEEQVEVVELKAEMAMEAIQQLSPAYRTVFNLYVMENYSHKQIGEMLGISEGTSKSNLAKAKANLKNSLKQQFDNIDNEKGY